MRRRRPPAALPAAIPALAALLLLPATGWGEAGGPLAAPPAAHDLHIAYADLALEGDVIAGRIRLFRDDLERALGPFVGADAAALAPGPEADALVLRYLRDHLRLEADGAVLEPELLQSGEDELDREPVWWVVVQYRAARPIDRLRVRNTLLLELFADQRNILKLVRFPDEKQKTFYFARGEEEVRVRW